eukprot:scaffold100326_cov51-Phaeocystis_antarctica.AAC.2
MSSSKSVKPEKSPFMSEMVETSQPTMGPYVSMAAVGLALNSWTAVTREALVVNVPGSEGVIVMVLTTPQPPSD